MTRLFFGILVAMAILGGPGAAISGEQSVTLNVEMSCPTCPYIVKSSLQRVGGVLDVKVSYADQIAVVRYDDERTNVGALTQATESVGFPSKRLN